MLARSLLTVLAIVVCLVGLIAPVLVDAHHWGPANRKGKRLKESPGRFLKEWNRL